MLVGAALYFFPPFQTVEQQHSFPSWIVFAAGVGAFLFASFRAWVEEDQKLKQSEEEVFPAIEIFRLEANGQLRCWTRLSNRRSNPAYDTSCKIEYISPSQAQWRGDTSWTKNVGILVPKQEHDFVIGIGVIYQSRALQNWTEVAQSTVELVIDITISYVTSITKTENRQLTRCTFHHATQTFQHYVTDLPIFRPRLIDRVWNILEGLDG
jgi:hypothetical protein